MVRLADGARHNQGRIEIWKEDEWQTLCDDLFDATRDAEVVCTVLGYEYVLIINWLVFLQHIKHIYMDT